MDNFPTIYFRYKTAPPDATGSFYLAQALCGKHLALHEQLMVINLASTKEDKEDLTKLSYCFHCLQYDLVLDYLNSSLLAEEYLTQFITAGYTSFLDKWIRWQTSLPALEAYWQKCVDAIETAH